MRGLKHLKSQLSKVKEIVASFTDAWIETKRMVVMGVQNKVASFTDAWIETLNNQQKESEKMSHLLQMRGLKHCYRQ